MQTQKINKDMQIILDAYQNNTKTHEIEDNLNNVNKFLSCEYRKYKSLVIRQKINNISNIDILHNVIYDSGVKFYLLNFHTLYKNQTNDDKLYFSIRYSKDNENNINLIRFSMNEYAKIDFEIINNEYIVISKIDIMENEENNDIIQSFINLTIENLYYLTYFLIKLYKDINFNFYSDFILYDYDDIQNQLKEYFTEFEKIDDALIYALNKINIIDFAIYHNNDLLHINNYDTQVESGIIENYNNFRLYTSNLDYNRDLLYYILDTYNKIIN